jgi:hypothetical protein
MATFQLKKGNDTFDLDTGGTVSKAGVSIGTWSTNDANQVVISKPDGTVPIDVAWQFNADNHLVLQLNGADAFDFSAATSPQPFFKTENAVLLVRPDKNKSFEFTIKGEWDLDARHNLTLTVNGVKSVLDGFIQDPRGRFMYHVFDKRDLTRESVLGFVGSWESLTTSDGVPKLKFTYRRADQTTDVFELPAAVTVNRTTNQFMYEYDKGGQTRRLQFVGELRINENFEITYVVDRQVSSSGQQQVASTTFKFAAVFHRNDFTGELQLAIKKLDGSGGTTVTIGGNFTAMLGQAQLVAGFSFSQMRNGAIVSTTVGFNGRLVLKDNGEITWDFERNATAMSINVNVHLQVGDARVDSRLNLESAGGKIVGVRFLLGVAF